MDVKFLSLILLVVLVHSVLNYHSKITHDKNEITG